MSLTDVDTSSIEVWEKEFKALQATKPGGGGGGGRGFESIFNGFGAMLQGGQRSTAPAPSAAIADLAEPIIDGYEVIRTRPHVKESFTQGICWVDEPEGPVIIEGGGGAPISHGSRVSRVDPETARVLRHRQLPPRYFGEGVAVLGDRVYQLTWTSRIGFVYDLRTLALVDTFRYEHEGWGITTDGTSLIVSDGTDVLRFYDPATLTVTRAVAVRALGRKTGRASPVQRLNALAYADGAVYANVWQSDRIAVIDPANGAVKRYVDLSGLHDVEADGWLHRFDKSDVCLNGVASLPGRPGELLVTGKMWPLAYEIRVVEGGGGGGGEAEGVRRGPADYYVAGGGFDPLGMGIK